MSDDNVTMTIVLDNSAAVASIEETKAKADAVVDEWARQRAQIQTEIRSALRNISSVISSIRLAVNLLGKTLDPWMDSLLTAVSATISTMISIGLALSGGVVTSPAAAVIFGVAAGLQVVTTAKIISEFAQLTAKVMGMQIQVNDAMTRFSEFRGGILGGMF